jgi:hypothetical protein
MTNHRKDRHVLAAAVRAGAALIVTANVRDFPAAALEPFGVEAVHPDDFLLDQLDLDQDRVLESLERLVARNTRTPQTVPELLDILTPLVPQFSRAVLSATNAPVLPVVAVSDDALLAATFPADGPMPHTPLGAAMLWQAALDNREEFATALGRLTADSKLVTQLGEAASHLDGYAMTTWVHDHRQRTDTAYVKFIRDLGYSAQAFAHAEFSDYRVLELVRGDEGWWRAYALYLDMWPPQAQRTGRPDTESESAT